MPFFVYTALTQEGTLETREGEFNSVEDLYFALQREGLTLVSYKSKRTLLIQFKKGKVKRVEIAELLHQLSFMLRSGIPLITALQDLERETKNPKLRYELGRIRYFIGRGDSFTDALAKTKIFQPVVLSLSRIGEESGTLDKTLEEASQHLYRINEIISQTKRAMIYPLFVLATMGLAMGFWFFYVLPQILKAFKEMGIKLPTPTVILLYFVESLSKVKLLIPLFVIGGIVILTILYKHPRTQIPFERILLKVPIFGRIRKLNFLAFFFEHFALLLGSGINIIRLLELLRDSFHRRYYQQIVDRMASAIIRGDSIAETMKREKIFKPLDIRMIMVGESTGRLEEQTKMLAQYYYKEVQAIVDVLAKILEPLVLTIAGILFFIIIVALIGPIYDLISNLGKGT